MRMPLYLLVVLQVVDEPEPRADDHGAHGGTVQHPPIACTSPS